AVADVAREQRSAAGRDDARRPVGEEAFEDRVLAFAKLRFALAAPKLRDGRARLARDEVVGVDERQTEPRGEERADGGLPSAHETAQKKGFHQYASICLWKPSTLRRSSSSESPPNFSSTAVASVIATMASPTTDAAATAQTSLRSNAASNGSLVWTSTLGSARLRVAIGFIAARH